MMNNDDKLNELDMLFHFVKPQVLKREVIFLFLTNIINSSNINETELKETSENLYYLIKFISHFEENDFLEN
jgi:hypothetical protein